MRKTFSLMLAVAMLFSIGLSSAATETTEPKTGVVTATYVPGEEGGQIISVDIDWKGMEFTYHDASNAVWDPAKHAYSEAIEATWEESDAYISITNHSNAILQANIAYTQKPGYTDMWLLFTDDSPYIGSAETTAGEGKECNVIVRTIPTGKLVPDTPSGTEVGEIKVTVASVDSYAPIIERIGSSYIGYSVISDSQARETIGFMTQDDYNTVDSCYTAAETAVNDQTKETYEKNAALNALFTAYYNKLYFVQ